MYCVYITYYSGTKLPSFYIGSTSIDKISKGYNGSVKSQKYKEIYMFEQKHNKKLFKTFIISHHKSRKNALKKEYDIQKLFDVVKNQSFFNEAFAVPNGFFGRILTDKDKQHMVKQRLKSGKGDYHHGKNPFKDKNIIKKIKHTLLEKTKKGDVSKYNKRYDITFKNKRYYSIITICKDICYSEKNLRKFLKLNNIQYLTDNIIDNILFLKQLEPINKKWMYRNIIKKDNLKYFLYYKLDIPEGYEMVEKYTRGLKLCPE